MPETATLDRMFYSNSSCGVCGKATLEQLEVIGVPTLGAGPRVEPELILSLPGRLRDAQKLFSKTGGVHAAGLFDAEEAVWNLRVLSSKRPPEAFVGVTNSDLAFTGKYAIQGNYNGIMIWDIANPSAPELVTEYVCPASQSDVSVYGDLLFVS
ncbi:MAG: formate dehydrogenase accessory sulfurtransferase FdhD, partial [Actinobacteria bacterium]|nr:formate dehydrogenase accessory sulfurtransferase FdhD [Actinomycetota bacterium]